MTPYRSGVSTTDHTTNPGDPTDLERQPPRGRSRLRVDHNHTMGNLMNPSPVTTSGRRNTTIRLVTVAIVAIASMMVAGPAVATASIGPDVLVVRQKGSRQSIVSINAITMRSRTVMRGQPGEYLSLDDVTSDQRSIVATVASGPGSVRRVELIDRVSGQRTPWPPTGESVAVAHVDVSPDGSLVAMAMERAAVGGESRVEIRSFPGGELVRRFSSDDLAITPEGQWCFGSADNATVIGWVSGNRLIAVASRQCGEGGTEATYQLPVHGPPVELPFASALGQWASVTYRDTFVMRGGEFALDGTKVRSLYPNGFEATMALTGRTVSNDLNGRRLIVDELDGSQRAVNVRVDSKIVSLIDPSGRFVVVADSSQHRVTMEVVNLDRGTRRRLPSGLATDWQAFSAALFAAPL
jgi:hypothetical protein